MKSPKQLLIGGGIILLAIILLAGIGTYIAGERGEDGMQLMKIGGMATSAPAAMDMHAEVMMFREESMAPDSFFPIPEPTAGQTAADVDQKIIKNGNLSVIVDDVEASAQKVIEVATEKGGFVQHSSVSEREDGTHFGSVTIRIPSNEFEAAVADVKNLAVSVENESISGQDVTEQFTDLEARLNNAKAQEATFLRILDQATNVQDTLAVQRELGNIRAQIESLEGRIQYLENQTSFSTLHISLSEEPSLRIPTKEFRPISEIKEAASALISIGQNVILGFIWLVIVGGGIGIPLAILIWIIILLIRKVLQKRK